jgi:hypothetical protein
MRILTPSALAAGALLLAVSSAHAQSETPSDAPAARVDDGYCDQVEGVASAQSALLLSPELFGSFGYDDQSVVVDAPDSSRNDLRLTAGVRYRLSGVYQGFLTRSRAKADCRRHVALGQVQGGATYAALAARGKVLDDAMADAERALAVANEDLVQRRSTAQDVNATRLRVNELRELAAATRRALEAQPAPAAAGQTMSGALEAFYRADAEVEAREGKLRRAQGWDLQVRFGYDKFLEGQDESPYFAVVSAGFNLGWLLQGSGNDRAAAGRRRRVREAGGGLEDATLERMRSLLAIDEKREQETGILLADLEQQLEQMKNIGGVDSRRYRQTVWFDLVKVKAEHAYYAAHVASLRQVLGTTAGDSE